MTDDLLLVVVLSGVAAVASVVGGLLALWHRSSTLISSLAFGVASGALIGTVTLEMLPTALAAGARRGNRALARVRRGHRHRHRQPGRGHERRRAHPRRDAQSGSGIAARPRLDGDDRARALPLVPGWLGGR